jgi:hypothetical protein
MSQRRDLEDLGIDGRMIMKWILQIHDERAGAAFVWVRTGLNCRVCWTRKWGIRFYKIWAISWLHVELLASQECLSFKEFIPCYEIYIFPGYQMTSWDRRSFNNAISSEICCWMHRRFCELGANMRRRCHCCVDLFLQFAVQCLLPSATF